MKLVTFFSFSIFLVILMACSSTNSTKAQLMSDLKNSTKDTDDLKRWISVLQNRSGKNGEVNFVFDNDEFKAYILADSVFLSSLGGARKGNTYSCSENSKYCSLCINLKDLSLGCSSGGGGEGSLGSERGLVASKQKATLRDMIVAGEGKRETRLVFSGYPAEVLLNKALYARTLSKGKPDVSCAKNSEVVICQALVNVTKL